MSGLPLLHSFLTEEYEDLVRLVQTNADRMPVNGINIANEENIMNALNEFTTPLDHINAVARISAEDAVRIDGDACWKTVANATAQLTTAVLGEMSSVRECRELLSTTEQLESRRRSLTLHAVHL